MRFCIDFIIECDKQIMDRILIFVVVLGIKAVKAASSSPRRIRPVANRRTSKRTACAK